MFSSPKAHNAGAAAPGILKTWVRKCLVWGAIAGCAGAFAQTYPSRPITIMVGYAAGGSNDVIARMLAQKLSQSLGQPVVIDNRPGAGTAIASQIVARSAPDGYTLLLADNPIVTLPAVMAKAPFKPLEDFTPITLVGTAPQFLFAPAANGPSATQVISSAKDKPGEVSIANPGAGSLAHLVAEMLQRRAGVTLNHVPYRGSAPALADVAAGHVGAGFSSYASGKALVDGGKLKTVAVTGLKRLPDFPNVPTFEELGYKDMEVDTWWGLVGPANLPRAITDKLQKEIAQIVTQPDIQEKYAQLNVLPAATTPGAFKTLMEKDLKTWTRVAREANISLE